MEFKAVSDQAGENGKVKGALGERGEGGITTEGLTVSTLLPVGHEGIDPLDTGDNTLLDIDPI